MSEGTGIAPHAAAASAAAPGRPGGWGWMPRGCTCCIPRTNTVIHVPECGLVARWGRRATPPGRWGAKVAVALHLAARGAEIAPPATRVEPGPHDQDGLEITLWEFVPHDPDPELDDDELAHSLERLHGHLASWPGELPDYRERIARTGRLLVDDVAMQAVPRDGLALLRLRFAAMAPTLLERARPTTVLHGGPHAHNVPCHAVGGCAGSISNRAAVALSRPTWRIWSNREPAGGASTRGALARPADAAHQRRNDLLVRPGPTPAPARSRRASPRRTRRGVRPARPNVEPNPATAIDRGAPEADSDAGRRCAKCGLDSPADRTAGAQTDGRSSPAAPGGTTRTGQRATPTSALETLPRNTALKAPRPREPTTIISARSSSATSARHSAGSP
jgi:hypothetical protein